MFQLLDDIVYHKSAAYLLRGDDEFIQYQTGPLWQKTTKVWELCYCWRDIKHPGPYLRILRSHTH